MGKAVTDTKNKDGETKVLFKKSNATMFSHSRTYSGASQIYSRSGILQLKKNLGNSHKYYTDKGKLKRDLSVETDFCVLRRYYRIKKNKVSKQNSSAKSRYSTLVDTEVETIAEFPDTSGCGDNETEKKTNLPLDIASLMIDNLKDLLNQWIQKHLIQNKDTKQKIDTVLDTLINKLDTKKTLESASGSTFILQREAINQEVKNKKVATASITCQYCKQKARDVKVGSSTSHRDSSSYTIPFQYKDIRIISTLSIPRSFHKRGLDEKKEQNSWYKMKKIKHKNIILSIDRSNKLIDSSSFDLVAISTKSLTKKCTNNDINVKKKKRHIVFFPKPFYKSATDDTSTTTNTENIKVDNIEINKHHLEDMPSLLKSLYVNDPAIITNIDRHVQYDTKNDNFTMTEKFKDFIKNKSVVTNDILNDIYAKGQHENCFQNANQKDSINFFDINPDVKKSRSLNITKQQKSKVNRNYRKIANRGKVNKRRKILPNKMSSNFNPSTYQSIHNKQFTFLYKKANSQMSQGKDFLKHCQNIFQYFEDYDGNKNIKLDVRINVFPMYECRTKDVCTDISNQTFDVYERKPTLLYSVGSTLYNKTEIEAPTNIDEESIKDVTEIDNSCNEYPPVIIPLLDGAVSQASHIFNTNSREKIELNSKQTSGIEHSTLTSELEIVQEISELRSVIKDLAAAAERFVSEQLKRESNRSNAETFISRNPSKNLTSSSKCEVVVNLRNPSKGVQYSKEFMEKQKLLSGLKITKEPKKKEFSYYSRLAKKSTSYRIIDSESILKVTDMTSKGNEMNDYKVNDEALTCSLPKSRSLFELTSEQRNKTKWIALFCDGYRQNPQCRMCGTHRTSSPSTTSTNCRKVLNWDKRDTKEGYRNMEPPCVCQSLESCVIPIAPDTTCYGYSSTIYNASDNAEEENLRGQQACKRRRGMGFGEGCIYCLLMWIPVIILGCLFYICVIKGKINYAEEKRVIGREGIQIRSVDRRNSSVFYVNLSDLGF